MLVAELPVKRTEVAVPVAAEEKAGDQQRLNDGMSVLARGTIRLGNTLGIVCRLSSNRRCCRLLRVVGATGPWENAGGWTTLMVPHRVRASGGPGNAWNDLGASGLSHPRTLKKVTRQRLLK